MTFAGHSRPAGQHLLRQFGRSGRQPVRQAGIVVSRGSTPRYSRGPCSLELESGRYSCEAKINEMAAAERHWWLRRQRSLILCQRTTALLSTAILVLFLEPLGAAGVREVGRAAATTKGSPDGPQIFVYDLPERLYSGASPRCEQSQFCAETVLISEVAKAGYVTQDATHADYFWVRVNLMCKGEQRHTRPQNPPRSLELAQA
jgi:hypothetical protein